MVCTIGIVLNFIITAIVCYNRYKANKLFNFNGKLVVLLCNFIPYIIALIAFDLLIRDE